MKIERFRFGKRTSNVVIAEGEMRYSASHSGAGGCSVSLCISREVDGVNEHWDVTLNAAEIERLLVNMRDKAFCDEWNEFQIKLAL